MRLPDPSTPPRRRALRSVQVLPTLVTMGNLLAGVLALAYVVEAAGCAEVAQRDRLWGLAAWMVLLGMFCDGLDGRLARLTRSATPFGAELDSLADIVTFGAAPALLARAMLGATFPGLSGRFLLALTAVYVVGAALRLARYNVESARTSPEGRGRLTMVFRGLPSPAAAGVVASLCLLWHQQQLRSLDWVLLFATPGLGLLMVSRLPYPHLANRLLEGRRSIPAVVLLVAVLFAAVVLLQETLTVVFAGYALSGPLLLGSARLTGWPSWGLREEADEAPCAEDGVDGEHPAREEGPGARAPRGARVP